MLDDLRNNSNVIFLLVPKSVVEYYCGAMIVGRSERQLCCYLLTCAVNRRGILRRSNECWTVLETVVL
jgi:hypothetical protein